MSKKSEILETIESIQDRIWWLLTRQQQLMGQDTEWALKMFEKNEDELRRARYKLAKLIEELAQL